MKHLFSICSALGVLLICSCEKDFNQRLPDEQEQSFTTKRCNGLSVSSFNTWGSAHNNILDQVNEGFGFDTTQIEELGDAIGQLIDYLVPRIASELAIYLSEEDVRDELNQMPWMVVNEMCFDSLWDVGGDWNLLKKVADLYSNSIIGEFEYNLICRIIVACSLNYDQSVTNSALTDSIGSWVNSYNDYGYDDCSDDGLVLGVVLNIANSSYSWWSEIPPQDLPPWVAADIAGALIGGVSGAVSSYTSQGQVSATAVGVSAGIGAIAGSTGSISRIANLLSRM